MNGGVPIGTEDQKMNQGRTAIEGKKAGRTQEEC